MSLAPFKSIYDVLNVTYFFTKITAMAPFTRTKLKTGKYHYVEAPKSKYLIALGVISINVTSMVLFSYNVMTTSDTGPIGTILVVITGANLSAGNAVTILHIAAKSSHIFQIFALIATIDKKMRTMRIRSSFRQLYYFQLSMTSLFVTTWVSNLIYSLFFAKRSLLHLIIEIGAFGINLQNLCIGIMYFCYFSWALAARLKFLRLHLRKARNRSFDTKQFLVDVSDIFLKIQKASNLNAETFLISAPIMYAASNFFLLVGILKFKVLQTDDSKIYALILGVFYASLIFGTVVIIEIVKHMKSTSHKVNEFVMSNFDLVELSELRDTFLLQVLHTELRFRPLGLFDLTFQKLLEGYGHFTNTVMLINHFRDG
uniref:Gustatory receptor n=1 Tax=Tribolium castaneum TaxID=7070 RepID=B8PUM9_TRICA|nr:gustatory receptor [Tribolium castaneum]